MKGASYLLRSTILVRSDGRENRECKMLRRLRLLESQLFYGHYGELQLLNVFVSLQTIHQVF
jgi:hypothetical protein